MATDRTPERLLAASTAAFAVVLASSIALYAGHATVSIALSSTALLVVTVAIVSYVVGH